MFLLGYDIGSSSVKASPEMQKQVNVSLLRSFRKQRRASLPYVPDGQSKSRKVGGKT